MDSYHQHDRKTLEIFGSSTLFGVWALCLRALSRMARRFAIAMVCVLALASAPVVNAMYEQDLGFLVSKLSFYLKALQESNRGRKLAMPLDEYHISTMADALDRFFVKADNDNRAIQLTKYNQARILAYLTGIFNDAFSEPGINYSISFNSIFWDALFMEIPELLLNPLLWPQPPETVFEPVMQPGYVTMPQPQVMFMPPQVQLFQADPQLPQLPVVPSTAVPRPHAAPRLETPPSLLMQRALEEAFQLGVAMSQQELEQAKAEVEKTKNKLAKVSRRLGQKQQQAGKNQGSTGKNQETKRSGNTQGFVITEPSNQPEENQGEQLALPSLAGIVPPGKTKTETLFVNLDSVSNRPARLRGSRQARDTRQPQEVQAVKVPQVQASHTPDNQALKPGGAEAEAETADPPALAPKLTGGAAALTKNAKQVGKILKQKYQPGRFKRIRSLLLLPATFTAAMGVAGWYVYNYLFAANSDVGEPKHKGKQKIAKKKKARSAVKCDSDFKSNIMVALCHITIENGTLENRKPLMLAMDKRLQELNEAIVLKNLIAKLGRNKDDEFYQFYLDGDARFGSIGIHDIRIKILAFALDSVLWKDMGETFSIIEDRAKIAVFIIKTIGFIDFSEPKNSLSDLSGDETTALVKMYASFFHFYAQYFDGDLEKNYHENAPLLKAGLESHAKLVAALNHPDIQRKRMTSVVCILQFKIAHRMASIDFKDIFLSPSQRRKKNPPPMLDSAPYQWMTFYSLKPNASYRISVPGKGLEYNDKMQALAKSRGSGGNIIQASPEGRIQMRMVEADNLLLTELEPQCESCPSRELLILNSAMPRDENTMYKNRYDDFVVAFDYSYYYTYHLISSDENDLSLVPVFIHKHEDDLLLFLESNPQIK